MLVADEHAAVVGEHVGHGVRVVATPGSAGEPSYGNVDAM
jgi:hypothetical protein